MMAAYAGAQAHALVSAVMDGPRRLLLHRVLLRGFVMAAVARVRDATVVCLGTARAANHLGRSPVARHTLAAGARRVPRAIGSVMDAFLYLASINHSPGPRPALPAQR